MVYNVAVIGSGFGARVHIPAVLQNKSCRLVAFSSRSLKTVRDIQKRYRIPIVDTNWRKIASHPDVDIVSIAVPPLLQPSVALMAAEQGKHLFLEKPWLAEKRANAALLRAIKKNHLCCEYDFEFFELKTWQLFQKLLNTKKCGRLRHIQINWQIETQGVLIHDRSWKMILEKGGGVLNNFASHSFHYIEKMFGPAKSLMADVVSQRGQNTGLNAWIELKSGIPVNLSIAGNSYRGDGHHIIAYGDRGTLKLDNFDQDYMSGFTLSFADRRRKDVQVLLREHNNPSRDGRIEAVSHRISRLLHKINQRRACLDSFYEAKRCYDVMQAAQLSSSRQAWVRV